MAAYTKDRSPVGEILISGAKGLAVSVIGAAILLFAFAGVAYIMEDPDQMTALLGYAALYVSAAAGGIAASRLSGDTGGIAVLSGAAAGAMLLFILILMSFLPAETTADPLSPLTKVLMYAAVPAVSALAGFLLRTRPQRRIKHKRRR